MSNFRSPLIQWALFLITVQLVLAPILPILFQSLLDKPLYDRDYGLTLDNYGDVLSMPEFGQALVNSMIFAALSTLFSQFFGSILAILIGRTDMPGRSLLGNVLLLPLVVSSLVLGFGWFLAYGPTGFVTSAVRLVTGSDPWNLYSIVGMSVVAGTTHVPLATLFCLGSTGLANSALEDAARSSGATPMRTLWSITLPLLIPPILYSGLLNFTSSLSILSIPLIFGDPVGITFFTTFLYKTGLQTATPNYGLVSTAALVLLLVVLLLVFLQNRLLGNTRRFVTVGGKAIRSKPFPLGRLRWVCFGFVALYALMFIVLPIGVLVLRASVSFLTPLVPFWSFLTFDNFQAVFAVSNIQRAIVNTFAVSLVAAALCTLLAALLAITVRRSTFMLRRETEYVAMIPRALPGIVAGIGFFYAAVFFPPVGWLTNSIWILVVAYVMGAIPTAFGAVSPSLLQIGPDLDRSARVLGADWWKAVTTTILPLMKPALFTCFCLLFLTFFKEYTVAVFLVSPGSEVIGTTLLQFWHQGVMGNVAALASIQILCTIAFIIVVRRVFGVNIYG